MTLDPSKYSTPIVDVYEKCIDDLFVNLARHFSTLSAGGSSAGMEWDVLMLAKLGKVNAESAKIIAKHLGSVGPMTETAIEQAMLDALKDVEPALKAAARAGILKNAPQDVHDSIQTQLAAYSKQAKNQLNLVNTVMLSGTLEAYRQGVYKATDIMKQLGAAQGSLNVHTGAVITGTETLQEGIRAAIKEMAAQNITFFIDNGGHKWTLEAYVSMDLRTTCGNAATQATFDRNADYGNDLVWVPINATARDLCYPWQGKVISMSNRSGSTTDLNGNRITFYPVSQTSYGEPAGLWGINCHHKPPNVFIPGVSSIRGRLPSKDTNDARYKLTQQQRKLERDLRYAKREAAMMDAAGDKAGFEAAAGKVDRAQSRLNAFVNSNGLTKRMDRTQVHGYNKSISDRVRAITQQTAAKNTPPPTPAPKRAASRPPSHQPTPTAGATLAMFSNLAATSQHRPAYEAALAARFDLGTDNAKAVFQKYVPPNGGAVVDGDLPKSMAPHQSGGVVRMNYAEDAVNIRTPGSTLFHEHGHLVDYKNGYISDNSPGYSAALRADYHALLDSTGAKGRDEQRKALKRRLIAEPHTIHGISDIIGGLSQNKARGCWGHSTAYWQTHNVEVEAFAHMFEASFLPDKIVLMETYLPTAWDEFKKILEGIK